MNTAACLTLCTMLQGTCTTGCSVLTSVFLTLTYMRTACSQHLFGRATGSECAYVGPVLQVLRLLLGLFEAGALPGMWALLAHFYSKERITMPLGWLMGALIVSQALGAPIAALLMMLDGHGGLRGWQW